MSQKNNPWQTLSSKIVYKNPYITVVEDKVIKPDGKEGVYAYIKLRPTVGIVALDKNSSIYLCKQFRYIFKDESWEIPRGFIEDNELPEMAARRELKEEAGLEAGKVISMGSLRLSIGTIDEQCKVFLAQDLASVSNFRVQTEEIEVIKLFPLNDVLSMIAEGEIVDGLTTGAVLMAKEFIEENKSLEQKNK